MVFSPKKSAPGRIRTCGTGIRNPKLYPLSYRRSQMTMLKISFFIPDVNINKSFCGCFTVQGAVFSKKAPWLPEA